MLTCLVKQRKPTSNKVNEQAFVEFSSNVCIYADLNDLNSLFIIYDYSLFIHAGVIEASHAGSSILGTSFGHAVTELCHAGSYTLMSFIY